MASTDTDAAAIAQVIVYFYYRSFHQVFLFMMQSYCQTIPQTVTYVTMLDIYYLCGKERCVWICLHY